MVKLDPKERPTLVINHVVCTTIFTEFVSLQIQGRKLGRFVSARKQDHLCLMLHTVIHVFQLAELNGHKLQYKKAHFNLSS